MAHIGCPERPDYESIDVGFLVGCVKSPYHAESSKQRHTGRNMRVCETHADRCAHGMLIVTALVDPRRILRAHSALPLPPRCHGLMHDVGI